MAADYLRGYGIDLQGEMDKAQSGQRIDSMPTSNPDKPSKTKTIANVYLPDRAHDQLWDIHLKRDGKIQSVHGPRSSTSESVPQSTGSTDSEIFDGNSSFLLPSLCHPHVHLDKCFILSHPKYDDLEIVKGDFAEALDLTSKAKARFEEDDLVTRGDWLIQESIAAGVTHMRAFVEVDKTVGFKCLDAGLKLKERYINKCEIQLCVFAQDPVFSPSRNYPEGKELIEEALERDRVDVVGSTPYVEEDESLMRKNVDWAVATAVRFKKHLDLHLDYNLDSTKPPLIYYVLDRLHKEWKGNDPSKTIVFGHCTRLTLFSAEEWRHLKSRIADLPVSLVGLPTSDLYMMDKPSEEDGGGHRVRGTLQIPEMIQKYGFQGAIGINNVGNAFTPQGNCDPLSIASMGVGVYQAGTKADAQFLCDCVSSAAKTAIGYPQPELLFEEGAAADFVVVNGKPAKRENAASHRSRRTLQDIIFDPPPERHTIKEGHPVA